MTGFTLDPRLAAGSVTLATLALCEARLQNDARWPWIVLVPRRPDRTELDDLEVGDRSRLIEEAVRAAGAVRAIGAALGRPVERINHGQLGLVVSQLHLHVVGRCASDPAWPGPVWGYGAPIPYREEALRLARRAARSNLSAS